jgi:hypothetical protein
MYPSKNTSLKMSAIGGRNMEAMLFITQKIYISVYALFRHISCNESSVHGHESFTVNFVYLGNKEMYCIFKTCCIISVLFSTKCRLPYFQAHKTHFFFSWKSDLNSTCVLCAEGKCYFQTYKCPYIYYTTSLLWDSEDDFSGSDDDFLGFSE